jgi:aerobic carbon-monoxide dehydrogenase large subunit
MSIVLEEHEKAAFETQLKPSSKNWVGQRVKRREDATIIRGRAQYVDDIQLPGTVHCKILRSPYAHARIKKINIERAKHAEGVLYVLSGAEADKIAKTWDEFWDLPTGKHSNEKCLAVDKVRFVGDPIAAVVATDRYLAEDALDLIEVDYEVLPAVVDVEKALEPGAPLVHDEWGDNIESTHKVVAGDVEKAFAEADLILEDRFVTQRSTGAPIETSGAVAIYDKFTNTLTEWSSTQFPHFLRTTLSHCLGIPESAVRCVAPDIGGGFGIKASILPHEIIVAILAMKLGVPVKYYEDRREHLTASKHGYGRVSYVKVAAKKDGTITAWKEKILQDSGAYRSWGIATVAVPYSMQPGVYRIPNILFEAIEVSTTKTGIGAYRAFGDAQMIFVREVMIDKIARKLGIDRAEIRLKNMIKKEDIPYTLPTGARLDSGSFEESFRKVLEMLDYEGIKKRKEPNVGVGFCVGIHYTSCRNLPMMFDADFETAVVRFEPTGALTVACSNIPQGQGHDTSLAQIAADEFGIDISKVRMVHGDTDKCPQGLGTWGSRCIGITGSAIAVASRQIKAKMILIASHLLEARKEDLVFEQGKISVKGTPARGVSLEEIAFVAWAATSKLPPGMKPGLDAMYTYEPPNTGRFNENGIGNVSVNYSNSADGAVVKVDPETGEYKILKYVIAHDCGVQVNPMLVEGQMQGGLCQGLGTAAYEDLSYDENGQPLATLFADYACPTAVEMPMLTADLMTSFETPSPTTPTGAKGAGELSIISPPAVLANALADAINFPEGIRQIPLTSERVYSFIKKKGLS